MSPLRVVFTTTTTSGEWRVSRGIFESSARTSLVGVNQKEEEEKEKKKGNQQLFFLVHFDLLLSLSGLVAECTPSFFHLFFQGVPLKKKCELRTTNGGHCDTSRQRAVHHRRHRRASRALSQYKDALIYQKNKKITWSNWNRNKGRGEEGKSGGEAAAVVGGGD